MQVFAVFGMTDRVGVSKRAQRMYPDNYRQIDDAAFLVATRGQTTQDVAARLGVDKERGIVVSMDAYYGFQDRGIWEWIDLKANDNG